MRDRFKRLGLGDNVYQAGSIVTADTGYANEANIRCVVVASTVAVGVTNAADSI
ncbi:MAG: hypothetical protein PF483_01135 [Halothiobacillus sp.]|nr:hypothetical protein [Halothiobacillus sp.]